MTEAHRYSADAQSVPARLSPGVQEAWFGPALEGPAMQGPVQQNQAMPGQAVLGQSQGSQVITPNHQSHAALLRLALLNPAVSRAGVATGAADGSRQACDGPEAFLDLMWEKFRLHNRHRVNWVSPPAVVTLRHFPGAPGNLAATMLDLARPNPDLIDGIAAVTRPPVGIAPHRDRPTNDQARAVPARPHDIEFRLQSRALANLCAENLADALTSADALLARRHLDGVLRHIGVSRTAALVQSVLDHLQTAWMGGTITALQRQLAMTMLQSALRLRLNAAEAQQALGCAMVSALPGTPDLCGVMLKVALLRRTGWSVRLLLPRSTTEIVTVARGLQPDLIVLAGSRLSVQPTERAMLTTVLPHLAALGARGIILGGKLAEVDGPELLRSGADAVCGALPWIGTIADHLATMPARAKGHPRGGPSPKAPHLRHD